MNNSNWFHNHFYKCKKFRILVKLNYKELAALADRISFAYYKLKEFYIAICFDRDRTQSAVIYKRIAPNFYLYETIVPEPENLKPYVFSKLGGLKNKIIIRGSSFKNICVFGKTVLEGASNQICSRKFLPVSLPFRQGNF